MTNTTTPAETRKAARDAFALADRVQTVEAYEAAWEAGRAAERRTNNPTQQARLINESERMLSAIRAAKVA